MDKREEIAEVDILLQKNEEETDMLQRYISCVQDEEELFRDESRLYIRNIDRLSDVAKGAAFEKIYTDAFAEFDKLKYNVDIAFQDEQEEIKQRLNNLYDEKDDLLNRKKQMEEEERQE